LTQSTKRPRPGFVLVSEPGRCLLAPLARVRKNVEAGQSVTARLPHFEMGAGLARLAGLAGGVARIAILLALRLKLNLLVDFPRLSRFALCARGQFFCRH